jgi:hypothetical protein
MVLFATFWGIIIFILAVLAIFGVIEKNDNFYFGLFFGLYVLLTPYLVYRAAVKSFNTHKILQEEITYEFLPDSLKVLSHYTKAELPWDKIHKVKEFKNWFLIYQSNKVANLIPKKFMTEQEVIGIREIIRNISGLKAELKK